MKNRTMILALALVVIAMGIVDAQAPDITNSGIDAASYSPGNGVIYDTEQTTLDVGTPSPGETLYMNNCRMCHGIGAVGGFAQRDIRSAGASRIRSAIRSTSDMNFLSTRDAPLTNVEIDAISAYLATLPRGVDDIPRRADLIIGEDQYRKSCTYCHPFGNNMGGKVGPDMLGVRRNYSDTFLAAQTAFPTEMIRAGANHSTLTPYWMPDLGHSDINAWNIAGFMLNQDRIGPLSVTPPIGMAVNSPAFNASRDVYFNRCAGCHGIYRMGGTGPRINESRSREIGTDGLGAIMRYGTPRGMGNFGQSGFLTEENITNLAAYLQLPPPAAPPLEMPEIMASWNPIVPISDRPTAPQYSNWENYFGVILRDAGEVAIFDGDTRREVVRLNTGFAVHILRSSADGRYFYAISRNGLVSLIDLYPAVPQIVATVKGCFDARSVDSSKFDGFEDAYAIEGCYWPPQYVVFNGTTLEPLQKVNIPMTRITDGATLREVRVAAIVASQFAPVWIISLKETGYVGIVNYSLPGFPLESMIPAVPSLHDGGFDYTGRYFMVAANTANKMVIVDLKNQTFVTSFFTGLRPHPGRGANWLDPDFGEVGSTVHLSEGKVSVYSTNTTRSYNWTVVREILLPTGGNSLFIKTHPNSPWVLADMAASSYPDLQKQICAINQMNPGAGAGCFQVATNGKAVHLEFNKNGTEVWVSDWATNGSLIIMNATTLDVITRITNVPTPTGKFNVYNTAHDIY